MQQLNCHRLPWTDKIRTHGNTSRNQIGYARSIGPPNLARLKSQNFGHQMVSNEISK